MKITILGAGPAGLYAAILLKKTRPDLEISVFEQNPPDATFGFGVVFSDQALSFLRADDADTADLIEPHMLRWNDIALNHKGEHIAIDGVGFAGIGRLEFLKLLQDRARSLGVEPQYNRRLESLDELPAADIVIGADGLNSLLRNADARAFGETLFERSNYFVWYGAECEFDALTQTFIQTPHGPMTAHHYAYGPGRSTFIIEMSARTFERSGFAHMSEPQYREICAGLFAPVLGGAKLIDNNSHWRRFPDLSCTKWYKDNQVLVGDALHTAHFSIGSGTRLALEDVIALVRALKENDWSVEHALPAYQQVRAPILAKITAAARQSMAWYEEFGEHMELDPWPFALSYIRRAGRIDAARLRKMAPKFTAELEQRGIDLEITP